MMNLELIFFIFVFIDVIGLFMMMWSLFDDSFLIVGFFICAISSISSLAILIAIIKNVGVVK